MYDFGVSCLRNGRISRTNDWRMGCHDWLVCRDADMTISYSCVIFYDFSELFLRFDFYKGLGFSLDVLAL